MNSNLLLLLARILLGADFVIAGYGKLVGAAGMTGYFGSLGLPDSVVFVYLVGAFELLAGLAVIVGFQVRIAAILLALFCVATGFMAHSAEFTILMKNIAMAGGFLALAGAGAGTYALERRTGRVSATV
ncbi:membrane protein [Aureimonas sp. SA4125]|uniref:DoxX family protein n=1 Tax=Aureimonas sp. SA4125 TaxID=2826993 RepID=UPI001CC82C07|nr:DoxX family protein [Aureimonas sp. SA4125]BDA82802.1 membrane protein [Aureimonas sp. SA4125]